MCKYCEGHAPVIYTGENDNHIIDVGIFRNQLIAEIRYLDDKGRRSSQSCAKDILFCPFCGRKLQQESRYHVEADWIHPHKDSRGEYLDDLTYDQAEAVRKQWVKDNIHKNVTMSKSELSFQGEGGNHGNQNTDKSDKG